jgi:glycolate oxidase FAD binding subunit
VYNELRGEDLEMIVRSLVEEASGRRSGFESRFSFKANIQPSRVAEFCSAATSLRPELDITAEALSGIVSGHSYSGLSLEEASALVERLANLAVESGGNLTIRRCPVEWKRSLPVWGQPVGPIDLMRHVKQTLDPQDLINPGRLFG